MIFLGECPLSCFHTHGRKTAARDLLRRKVEASRWCDSMGYPAAQGNSLR
jgi:hypothetical protein